ncbi:hypothetical protein CLAFUW4_05356 [Fulvia fulva]|uniref:Uncharacterized protein n=1 Tax=Passalora fulva TaxID=5499 RepID=A0A9Q8P8Z2_PASFU|nr:uncharacterized protein CLAFUR5_05504 [Fulvia fulva]KAK4624734.1 hypothetical protein CLAFUR4_05350 [Fulvia fulva]KAK4625431.1 hypothetical protein CLAFUR0_05358 [Fulvia fulva]UJO17416.1 hypothetical protein CLAFUR5_05504 [Fulvia fulva]WPV15134.1 hypothetical protein CLAFUW4_05356 [Fulvia fulva]WPV30534.1 hypothetical protein CLAFUW7_05354 [Fulvia fulva]
MAPITMRPPTFSSAKAASEFDLPGLPWLEETWHVTHSSLPMWRSKRNVRIQYTLLEPSSPEIIKTNTDRLDDLVTYQSLTGAKVSTVKGVDKTSGSGNRRGEWDWRGKGWLKIAGSHWEILGWGEEEHNGNKWMVTMFVKTMFTPAGLDVYSKAREGLNAKTLADIKAALSKVEDGDVQKMVVELFEITSDGSRTD